MLDREGDLAQRQIVVDARLSQRLAQLYELQMGSAPSATQLHTLIDSYVRDEVLYREALRTGLDRDDEIVRRRLIQKFEFLNGDLATVEEPSEQELQSFYRAHLPDFSRGPTVTFDHVYFSPDVGGSRAARQRAESVRKMLLARAAADATDTAGLGDSLPLQSGYVDLDEADTARLFGNTPVTHELFSQPAGAWAGPFESGLGWHLIRVARRTPGGVEPFEAAREQVRLAYIQSAKEEENRKQYERMRARYSVVRPETPASVEPVAVARAESVE